MDIPGTLSSGRQFDQLLIGTGLLVFHEGLQILSQNPLPGSRVVLQKIESLRDAFAAVSGGKVFDFVLERLIFPCAGNDIVNLLSFRRGQLRGK